MKKPRSCALPAPRAEWWGVDEDALHHAKKLAAAGYRTVVPDLYRGKLGVEAEEAHHMMSSLDFPGAVEDIRGAARFLKGEGEGSAKVGVVGFCMGGALTLASAVLAPEIDAAAPFYGTPPAALADVSKAKVPVQGHYGATDAYPGSDPKSVDALEEQLKASGVEYELFRYPGVGHAFLNETAGGIARRAKLGQGGHDQAAVDLAYSRLLAFFAAKLK